jgi:hypothetical protein
VPHLLQSGTALLLVRLQHGDDVLAEVDGRVQLAPAREGGRAAEVTLERATWAREMELFEKRLRWESWQEFESVGLARAKGRATWSCRERGYAGSCMCKAGAESPPAVL